MSATQGTQQGVSWHFLNRIAQLWLNKGKAMKGSDLSWIKNWFSYPGKQPGPGEMLSEGGGYLEWVMEEGRQW